MAYFPYSHSLDDFIDIIVILMSSKYQELSLVLTGCLMLDTCENRESRDSLYLQGLFRSWKTWKVMEFVISISRPRKSWKVMEKQYVFRK